MNQALQSKLNHLQKVGWFAGFFGLTACGLGFALNRHQFYISYLVGYTFWLGLSLGCLGVAMIHHLTGGRWGFVTRRFLESGFMTLPLMAVLFIPLLFGLHELYPWARPDAVAASETLQRKAMYLNPPWYCARTVFCLALWLLMAFCLRHWSLQQDATTDPAPTIRLRFLSGPGIVLYPLTATFAFVDWVMSIEPKWYSTIFLVIGLIGQILTAFAFVTLLLAWFRDEPPYREIVTRTHFHDLGNLLLAFVIFWTYVSFSQWLIIYSGNLPREIDWYLHRIAGGWKWVIALLAIFHFFVPFFLLLFRVMKQNVARLAVIAALIFGLHGVEVYWVIEPSFFPEGVHIHWLDFAAVLGLGGAWLAMFAANMRRHAPLPQNDPRIEYSAPNWPMQNEAQNIAVSLDSLRRKHENANPPVRWILFGAGLVLLMLAGCLALIWFAMHAFSRARPLDSTVLARGIITAPNDQLLQRFPSPGLQINPHDDLVALRAREDEELKTYGWVDRTNGLVRIPIERAMDLILQRGLPTRASNAPTRTGRSSLELIQERSQTR